MPRRIEKVIDDDCVHFTIACAVLDPAALPEANPARRASAPEGLRKSRPCAAIATAAGGPPSGG